MEKAISVLDEITDRVKQGSISMSKPKAILQNRKKEEMKY